MKTVVPSWYCEHEMIWTCAVTLSVGAVLWSVFCLPFMVTPLGLYLLPGYLVTAGYIVRASRKLRQHQRRIVWLTSTIVHGAWFLIVGVYLIWSNMQHRFESASGFGVLSVGWWLITTVASVACFFAEPPDESASESAVEVDQG